MNMRPLYQPHSCKPKPSPDRMCERIWTLPKAVACLTKDRDARLAFFDFPAEQDHLRTSNPIESVFATVRHRTVRTKGALSAKTAKLMVFKLVNAAANGGD
jgi:transposase-like protein